MPRPALRLVFRRPGQAWGYEATRDAESRPDVGVEGDIPLSFYTDAKAENGESLHKRFLWRLVRRSRDPGSR